MSIYTFTNDQGQTFTVKGPPDLTQAQAQEIFNKQSDTGSLVGLKPGGLLSAATQAAKGLTSALASLGQQASGVIGALGGGIASAAGQIGSLASKAYNSATSIVNSTVSAVKGALSSTPVGGINVADYAKQATALAPIGGMTTAETTGVLAQAKQIVGQAADKITNTKGVGSYGFDIKQLETAGYVKPGTSALVNAGSAAAASISSVLKSPSVFTGKDGIKDVNGILSNPSLQDKTQQGLMAQASAGLKSLGVPVDQLGAANAAGLITSAAKNLPDVAKFAKGLPLPPDIKAGIDQAVSLGSFAVKLTDTKITPEFKEETVPVPSADTTNRETVNAATSRVIGNQKIPVPDYGPKAEDGTTANDVVAAVEKANAVITSVLTKLGEVETQVTALESRASITESDWAQVDAQYQIARSEFNNSTVRADLNAVYNSAPAGVRATTKNLILVVQDRVKNLVEYSIKLKERLVELKQKIQ